MTATVFPLYMYVSNAFPNINPIITPIFPNLFNIPAIIPERANDAISIGSAFPIIPITVPIVIPAVAPTIIPFFHPNTNIIMIINTCPTFRPKSVTLLIASNATDTIRAAPIISSIENASFIPHSLITINDSENIL